ncbi:hypothetical protein PPTG_04968 [Phytophthora nicotianae INRA-310]|uniref:B box-type domain-containing protein n=2 Tax=Phytophthora nicotianae (strain INRA-310) TaxID=761204 RepID=W2R308_PHYN3|nr:hypothetical protein PPTG_04968 [Phytophthora nicotianae INRA-310]ETN19763.1 hypothetical protein PPTG_04968 [Phytophthora nicotianae INRA-310]
MAVVEANEPRVERGANAWNGMLTDAVMKCGRDSERRLYMYGISLNRCPKCQARLRADTNTCVSCHYSHKTLRKCMRCSQKNDPVMWCAECDAYFCASCHKKPHVLMLGSSKPHHCFPIDGASGKHFVEGAWSGEFIEMVRAAYRLRLHDKMEADEAKAKSTAAFNGVAGQTVPAKGASPTATPPAASAAVASSTAVVPPTAATQEQSRKRQLPSADDRRGKKSTCTDEASRSSGQPAAAPMDGMSLYDRVKAMHDMRAKVAQSNATQARSPKMSLNQLLAQQNEERLRQKREQEERPKREADRILQKEQHRQQEQERKEQLKKAQEEQAEQRRREEEQRQQQIQKQQEEQRQLEGQRRQEELRQQALIQEQQRQRRMMEERMRHEQILREQEARRQAEAQSLMHDGNRFVSQAQRVLNSQPGFAVASMAPSTISAPMPQSSNARFTRIPSPVNVSPHAPRFQPASPSPASQAFPYQSAPVSNGYSSMTNEQGSQVYQGPGGVPVSRFETISHDHDGNHHLVVRDHNVQQQQQQQAGFSDAMVPHRMAAGAGEGRFSPSKSGEDDELRAIWVSDYDNVNALVMQLDVEITKRTEEGHEFVHRSNTITIPEQLKIQINSLCAQRDAAIKKRFESVVRVLIFSDAVRSFAQQNEHVNIWSDVPAVLTSSHKKCAELAAEIREFESQAQKLREGIDEAVSSGNPAQMQNVAHLGALIADLEQKIRTSNGERDKQFIFMFQFSDTLRNMVRAEWAAPGRGLRLPASQ